MITSNQYSDPRAVALSQQSFRQGSLQRASHARPGKLFTAHESLAVAHIGTLHDKTLTEVIDAVVALLRRSLAT